MEINFWAVLMAAISSIVVGSIWYGPLFGKMYMNLVGMNEWSAEKKAKMTKAMPLSYVGQFIASLVMFYVLAWLMMELGKTDVMGGIQTAVLVWVGFIVTLKLGDALWVGKMKLFWLSSGGSLITAIVGGIILGLWH